MRFAFVALHVVSRFLMELYLHRSSFTKQQTHPTDRFSVFSSAIDNSKSEK